MGEHSLPNAGTSHANHGTAGASLPKAYRHPVEAFPVLKTTLASLLPESLRVLRRLQFPPAGDNLVALATFPPFSTFAALERPFAVGVFDPDSIQGGQASVFSSVELEGTGTLREGEAVRAEGLALARDQILSLLSAFSAHSAAWRRASTRGRGDDNSGQDVILVGSVHSLIADLLREYSESQCPGLVRDDIGGKGGPYQKFVFRSSDVIPAVDFSLPPETELQYDVVRPDDYELVAANNEIVRNASYLYRLPGFGIREVDTGVLVAWAFFGVEGCVRTVHVEPRYRRKRMAKKVVASLLREKMGVYSPESEPGDEIDRRMDGTVDWTHVDVAADNVSSVRLFESLGATYSCDVYWVRVDLAKLF